MAIAEGLSATKAGFDLLKSALEMLKREQVDRQEVAAQLLELQGLLMDTRQALVDAEEENRSLKAAMEERDRLDALRADVDIDTDGHYLYRKSDRAEGKNIPYCPICWGESTNLIALAPGMTKGTFRCGVHNQAYRTSEYRDEVENRNQRFSGSGGGSQWS
ncbi:MAG: hypothetical protein ABL995_01410 [Bryobacteraceae bacterium]